MNEESKNIVWHPSQTTAEERRALLGQSGCVLWFTGLSGSGKSTIAHALERALIQQRRFAYVLDGDNIRYRLNKDLGFSEEDRNENIRRIAEVARLFAECGTVCISAFISPFKLARKTAKDLIGADRFIEIYLSTPLDMCEKRDVKGLYKKARKGEIADFTGITSPFEPPDNADLIFDTTHVTPEEAVSRIIGYLKQVGFIGAM